MRLNVGCGSHYARGWINIDVIRTDNTHPDIVGGELPFRDGAFERVYLGHVMEHVPWPAIPGFLAECKRVLAPDGELLATGPDVRRTLMCWRDGLVGLDLMHSVMEHADDAHPHWPQAVHHWNCHEQRMVDALRQAGFRAEPMPVATLRDRWDGWPVVCWSAWQCAALARHA